MKSSLQFKIGLSYLSIIVIVLAILNTYPLIESQNLVFRSKESTVSSCVKVMESALSGLSGLTEGNVEKALSGLEETGVSRVMVTDTAGRVLYDTRQQENARGQYAFYTEIAQALEWNDARNYDFCLDTTSLSYEKLVQVVKAYLEISEAEQP